MGEEAGRPAQTRQSIVERLREVVLAQGRSDLALIGLVTAGVAVLGALAFLYHVSSGQPVTYLLGDTTKQIGIAIDPLPGAYTEIGVLGWFAAAVVALFSAALLRHAGHSQRLSFFVFSGLLMLWFALDDRFQFHEYYFPKYLGFGSSSYVLLYVVLIGVWTFWFRRVLLEEGLLAIASVYLALALTTGIDFVNDKVHGGALGGTFFGIDEETMNIAEEFSKLLGIGLWAAFIIRAGYRAVARSQQPSSADSPAKAH